MPSLRVLRTFVLRVVERLGSSAAVMIAWWHDPAMTDRPWTGDACSLVDAFRRGERTPLEELETCLAAIDASDLNAFAFLDPERAHDAARHADLSQPFGGVPVGIKELEPVAGWPWTEGSLVFRDRYPGRFHIVRYEDIVADTRATLSRLADDLGLGWSDTLTYPSFNGERLDNVYPWGTIVTPTPAVNIQTARELSDGETREIQVRTTFMRDALGYGDLQALAAA